MVVKDVDEDVENDIEAHIAIDSISARVVIADVTKTEGLMMHVQQRFTLQFVDKESADPEPTFGKSGNPGYIFGLPLLLGKNDPANEGAVLTYDGGFVGTGSNLFGMCTTDKQEDISDPVVTFGENLSYGCAKEMTLA